MMPATVNMSDSFTWIPSYVGQSFTWMPSYVRQTFSLWHEKNCEFAKYLHDNKTIYALYGALDGLSLSYSSTKYWFDMMVAKSNDAKAILSSRASNDLMHNWMTTPEGIIAIALETIFLVGFSIFANLADEEERAEFQKCKIVINNDAPIEENHLYLYVKDDIIYAKARHKKTKDKEGEVECFIIKETCLAEDFDVIKAAIAANQLEQLTKSQLAKISEATTHRNNVQAKYNAYLVFRYTRDVLKALKNASKAIRSTMLAAGMLHNNMQYMLLPTALGLGALSGFNRIWYRSMKDHRKLMQVRNKELAKKVRNLEHLSKEEAAIFLAQITPEPDQSFSRRFTNYVYHFLGIPEYIRMDGIFSQVFDGLIGGLYLYMGALVLMPLPTIAFSFLAGCSALFVLLSVATRVYTEFEYQRKLASSLISAKLAISGKRMESLFAEMQSENALNDNDELVRLHAELNAEIEQFSKLQEDLWSHSVMSPGMVILSGLRDGLAGAGAVGSFMFAVVAICGLFMAPITPALVIGCVSVSLAIVMAGFVNALVKNWYASNDVPPKPPRYRAVRELLETLKVNKIAVQSLDLEETKKIIWEGMMVDSSSEDFWQGLAELGRALGSALGMGPKILALTLNPDQVQSHAFWMLLAASIYSFVYLVIFGLRTDAREFNDMQVKKSNTGSPPLPPVIIEHEEITEVLPNNNDSEDEPPPPEDKPKPPDESHSVRPQKMIKRNHHSSFFPVPATTTASPSSLGSSPAPSMSNLFGLFGKSALSTRQRSYSESDLYDKRRQSEERHNPSPNNFY